MWATLYVLATITSDGWYERNILYIVKAYVTLEIVKSDKCPNREWASAYCSVQYIIMSSNLLYQVK